VAIAVAMAAILGASHVIAIALTAAEVLTCQDAGFDLAPLILRL